MGAKEVFFLFLSLTIVYSFENVAVGKVATMSYNEYNDKWLAGTAVDNDTNQDISGNSCAVTSKNNQKQVWWRVDLGSIYHVISVIIYYRKADSASPTGYTHRLSGFSIYLSETSNWWVGNRCYQHNGGNHATQGPPEIFSVPCDGAGRYLTIYKQRNLTCTPEGSVNFCAIFELCEVQVLACDKYTYGPNCSNTCSRNCLKGAECNRLNGQCDNGCTPGYMGTHCDTICSTGSYGQNCTNTCENCVDMECDHITGTCARGCNQGWDGPRCDECPVGFYGQNCSQQCGSCFNASCDHVTGACDGCASGWLGIFCNVSCPVGTYGDNCQENCSENCLDAKPCHNVDGSCYGGCQSGWRPHTCKQVCDTGSYGHNCSLRCDNCQDAACYRVNGLCTAGCKPGWRGIDCNGICSPGYYGTNCSLTCPSCSETCHHVTGSCLVYESKSSSDLTAPFIVVCVIAGILIIVIIILLFYLRRQDRQGRGDRYRQNSHLELSSDINGYDSKRQSEAIHGTIGDLSRQINQKKR